MKKVKQIKEALLRKRERPSVSKEHAISTGSTLLNLACTNDPRFGFQKGAYYFLVGDSTSGKTWLSLSCFAEACLSKAFEDYLLIFDDVEGGALMDVEHYFGKAVAKRMESPAYDDQNESIFSATVEDFYFHITDLIKEGKPFIYVLDSQDALDSESAGKKFEELKAAHRKGKETAGSYGDGKAKIHSQNIRGVLKGLRETGSILIIIGQTRDNLGLGFAEKTRSGGKSLRFYANLEIWTSVGKRIKKTVRDKERSIGCRCIAEVKKNRVTGRTGKDRQVEIPIYYDYGIDDVGSMVDFLVSEKHWALPKGKTKINARELMFEGTRAALIKHIEEEDLEEKVRDLVGVVWNDIDEASKPDRKRRYA